MLVDGPADGARNLAIDEALLEVARSEAVHPQPTLRLYRWSPAALSLGRSQPADEAHDPVWLRRNGVDLVRRPTGGTAVFHENELTYSVTGPLDRPPFARGVVATYRILAEALLRGLRSLVPALVVNEAARGGGRHPACFAALSTCEISVGGRKLIGSAQLRRGRSFLQHGSIPLKASDARLARALGSAVPEQTLIDFETAAGRATAFDEVARAIRAGFEQVLGAEFVLGGLSQDECLLVERLRAWRYSSIAWTHEGRLGERERRWGPEAIRHL